MHGTLPLFSNPWTGQTLRCRDYFTYALKSGQGFYEFFGINRPEKTFRRRERPPLQQNAGDILIEIKDLHKKMGTPPPEQDKRSVVQQGVNVSGIFVVPRGKGTHYGIGQEGELVKTKNDFADGAQPPGVLDPEYVDIDVVHDLEEATPRRPRMLRHNRDEYESSMRYWTIPTRAP